MRFVGNCIIKDNVSVGGLDGAFRGLYPKSSAALTFRFSNTDKRCYGQDYQRGQPDSCKYS
jgi:hypothetical protein